MNVISLARAISEISDACESAHEADAGSPFFFLVGAGVSDPSVPLAPAIVDYCKEQALGRDTTLEYHGDDAIGQYSFWLEKAYPQPIQRQRYFEKLIEGKNISQATLRLAHLLLSEGEEAASLPSLVVTTNFDDHVSRALNIFGTRHVVSDHPATSVRINPEDQRTVQIVHVHGSYEFYDIANLRGEINEAANSSDSHIGTMAALLDNVLRSRSPLVVGYSGWKDDVVMTALRRRLNGQILPNNVYWFCYTRAAIEALPDFLKNHQNVRLVLPESRHPVAVPDQFNATIGRVDSPSAPDLEGSRKGMGVTTLPAQSTFDRLIQEFGLPAPRFTRDPLAFLVEKYRDELPEEDMAQSGESLYSLDEVIEQLEQAVMSQVPRTQMDAESVESVLTELREMLRRAAYREAIRAGKSLADNVLPDRQSEELTEILYSSAIGLLDDSQDELDAYSAISDLGQATTSSSVGFRTTVVNALLNKAVTLNSLGSHEDELVAYDDLIDRFRDDTEPYIHAQVVIAMRNKGVVLMELGRYEAALSVFDSLVEQFGTDNDIEVRTQVASALANKGLVFGLLNRYGEELAVYDELVDRFADDEGSGIHTQLAGALRNKGIALMDLERNEEAVSTFDSLLHRFLDEDTPGVRVQVASALRNKGAALGRLDRHEDAISTSESLFNRFADDEVSDIRAEVDGGLLNKAVALGELGRQEDELPVYETLLRRLDGNDESAAQMRAAVTMRNKGLVLIDLGRREEAIGVFEDLIKRFGEEVDINLRIQVAAATRSMGAVISELGRYSEAIAVYDDLVGRFGDDTDVGLRVEVAGALRNKGIAFGEMARHEEELTAYDELLGRFAADEEVGVRVHVAGALRNKGVALEVLGRVEDAFSSYVQLLDQFELDDQPEILKQVHWVRDHIDDAK